MIKATHIQSRQHIQALHTIMNRAAELADGAEPMEGVEQNFAHTIIKAHQLNPWFTLENMKSAFSELAHMLRPEAFQQWIKSYPTSAGGKRVGLILAGNIPMVGFHDILSANVAGHKVIVKAASQDAVLLPAIFGWLNQLVPESQIDINWVDGKLGEIDAIIATGTNNTARYFEYYFGKYPHIFRKNRNSVAILNGAESDDDLARLGSDIFSYFGMGCRNVSKIYLHKDFDINRFFSAMYPHREIVNHHKYANNYDYYRALWMMNREEILDNGFLILRPSEAIGSPVGTIFYERYDDESVLRDRLNSRESEIQCVVSLADVPFGNSQKPELWDYADGVDTMSFLCTI